MGSGGGTRQSNSSNESSHTTSNSMTYASELSKEQLKILQQREQQYQDYFFPELKTAIAETNMGSTASNAQMQTQSNAINTSYAAADKQTSQNLAQQGMLGDSSGVSAALKAANNRSRSSALAMAYYNTLQAKQTAKQNLMGLGLGMSPTPTSSAEYYSKTASNSTSTGTASGSANQMNIGILR